MAFLAHDNVIMGNSALQPKFLGTKIPVTKFPGYEKIPGDEISWTKIPGFNISTSGGFLRHSNLMKSVMLKSRVYVPGDGLCGICMVLHKVGG